MFRLSNAALLISAIFTCGPASGQEPEPDAAPAALSAQVQEGFWPSERLMHLLILRWADEAATEYDLDEKQRETVRERMLDHWPKYFNENRAEIQQAVNQFIEMRMELEPPSRERVQEWARRTTPVFASFRDELRKGTDEFRKALKPLQRAKFELDVLKVNAGMQFAQARLQKWESGEFEEREFWEPTPSERRRRREERRAQESESQAPADPIEKELTGWDAYVEEFIRTYALDDGQIGTARSLLSELKQRAIAHRDRNRDRIVKLEARIAQGKSSSDEQQVKEQIVELYGPVDEMFSELKSRLDQLPTSQQKARAAQRGAEPDPRSDAPTQEAQSDETP